MFVYAFRGESVCINNSVHKVPLSIWMHLFAICFQGHSKHYPHLCIPTDIADFCMSMQVASQPAMQCLPLVMEPESRFYTDPVVVLDFQSLYPSMMIAYNLCFSTCLGKVTPDNPKILGVTSLNLGSRILKDLKDSLTFTPNGMMFASSKVKKKEMLP